MLFECVCYLSKHRPDICFNRHKYNVLHTKIALCVLHVYIVSGISALINPPHKQHPGQASLAVSTQHALHHNCIQWHRRSQIPSDDGAVC